MIVTILFFVFYGVLTVFSKGYQSPAATDSSIRYVHVVSRKLNLFLVFYSYNRTCIMGAKSSPLISLFLFNFVNTAFFCQMQLFRHGDRAPIQLFPEDVHGVAPWPRGLGQLTDVCFTRLLLILFSNNT